MTAATVDKLFEYGDTLHIIVRKQLYKAESLSSPDTIILCNTIISKSENLQERTERERKCSDEINKILAHYDCSIKVITVIEENGNKLSFHKNIIANG